MTDPADLSSAPGTGVLHGAGEGGWRPPGAGDAEGRGEGTAQPRKSLSAQGPREDASPAAAPSSDRAKYLVVPWGVDQRCTSTLHGGSGMPNFHSQN